MLLAAASDQLHLAVRTAKGFVHADARLRRVVETQANLNGRSSASIDGACAGSREHRMATLTAVGTTLGGPLGERWAVWSGSQSTSNCLGRGCARDRGLETCRSRRRPMVPPSRGFTEPCALRGPSSGRPIFRRKRSDPKGRQKRSRTGWP